RVFYVAKDAMKNALRGDHEVLAEIPGSELVDRTYTGPFDELPAQQGVTHRVIAWEDVSPEEGTGIVHNAPGCGQEDYALGKEFDLPVIAPINESGLFLDGFGWLAGKNAADASKGIEQDLKARDALYRSEMYTHRYPVCWRCGTDLLFRLVDEWFISMHELRELLKEQ